MDAIHDVFCKLYAHSSSSSLLDTKRFLFKSLKNRLIDIYRKEKMTTDIDYMPDNEMPFLLRSTDSEEALILEEEEKIARKRINKMLQSLSPRQREIIYLRYVKEYSYDGIAECHVLKKVDTFWQLLFLLILCFFSVKLFLFC